MKIIGENFFFVRHAETFWNEKKLCQGHQDIELSDNGRQKSLDFAQSLANASIQCICSSPLKRAHHTAQMIHRYHPDALFELMDAFMERGWGDLEGCSSREMYEIEKREEKDPDFVPSHGIEGKSEFQERIIAGLNQAFELHPFPLIVSQIGRAHV